MSAVLTYSKLTKPPAEEEEGDKFSIAAKELSAQAKYDWIKNPVTKEMLSAISEEVADLEENARKMACTYHQHNNHHQIINLLVRASTLREVVKNYAS